jgi:hypothetical protein
MITAPVSGFFTNGCDARVALGSELEVLPKKFLL